MSARPVFDAAAQLALDVDEALLRLNEIDPVQANIVELRFFGGLTVAEVAEVLHLSKRKVEHEWQMTRAWLRRELSNQDIQPNRDPE